MRAKKVSFERGMDPKEALDIGNKNLRIVKKALDNEKYFEPVLQPLINGLVTGSIPESLADKFIFEAMIYYNSKKQMVWYNWFINTSNIFWDKQEEKLMITFYMPPIENDWGGGFERKIYCQIFGSESFVHGKTYMINSYLKTIEENGETDNHFHETNMFYPDDEIFKFPAVVHNINRVVEKAIKNLD